MAKYGDPDEPRAQADHGWLREIIGEPPAHRTMVLWDHAKGPVDYFNVTCIACGVIGAGNDKPLLDGMAEEHEETAGRTK